MIEKHYLPFQATFRITVQKNGRGAYKECRKLVKPEKACIMYNIIEKPKGLQVDKTL